MPEEKYFPRGGKKPAVSQVETQNISKKRKNNFDLPVLRSKKVKEVSENEKTPLLIDISWKTLSEGMVILGCINELSDVELKINLPGRIIGYASVANISEEFTAYLKELLNDAKTDPLSLTQMFKPGQIVVVKVQEISSDDEKYKRVNLTLKPNLVYDDVSLNDLMEGIVISAAVQSIEDYGYVMNCGIRGVRAFLRKSQALNYEKVWNDGRPLGVGQVIRCLIKDYDKADGCANVQLLADPEAVANAIVEETDVPLKSLIIGMGCQMTVSKVIPSGLVVELINEKTAFVHSNYQKKSIQNLDDLLQGRVIYIEPLTKNIFLTMLDIACGPFPPPDPFENIKKGQIFRNAKVKRSNKGNVRLKLGEETKIHGTVTSNHMGIKFTDDDEETFLDLVKKKFPVGSTHTCKVLEYDYMLEQYYCTMKMHIINQKFSSLDEIAPGIVTDCTVLKSTPRQILLKVDAIRGVVESIHCTDIPIRSPDTLLKEGQRVRAKVLAVKKPICEFTLKPILINSKRPMLTKFADAEYNVPYDGVIVTMNQNGVLVKFYGDFKCFIKMSRLANWQKMDEIYFVGQVVTCYVEDIDFENEMIRLRAEPVINDTVKEEFKKKDKVLPKVGRSYVVHVDDISSEGLIVTEQASGTTGLIPAVQLTDCFPVANALCCSYRKGDALDAYCLSVTEKVIFTTSQIFIEHFKSSSGEKLTKEGLSELQEGMIVPSIVTSISCEEVIVKVPMEKEDCYVSIHLNKLSQGSKGVGVASFENLHGEYQTLMVKIQKAFRDAPCVGSIFFRIDLGLIQSGLMLLKDFLSSYKKIHADLENKGHPIGKINIGSVVKGTVTEVSNFGVTVDLDVGIKAEVKPAHFPIEEFSIVSVGERVEGTVLFVDVVNQCVEMSLIEKLKVIMSRRPRPHVGKLSIAEVIVSRPEVTICRMLNGTQECIAYVPSQWHINYYQPIPKLEIGEKCKIYVKMFADDVSLGVPRELELLERKAMHKLGLILTTENEKRVENLILKPVFLEEKIHKNKQKFQRYWEKSKDL